MSSETESFQPDTALRVVVRGGGDLGTGVAWRLHRCGFRVLVTEVAEPRVIRRAVAFASAIYGFPEKARHGAITVDGVTARLVPNDDEVLTAWERDEVPVVVDAEAAVVRRLQPEAVVDAIMAKRNLGTSITDAPIVVVLGPGFTAGIDCHAVVETHRGHNLGRVIEQGSAEPDTGVPGRVGGEGARRVLRATRAGAFRARRAIGDRVEEGTPIATVEGEPIRSLIDGVVRGLLQDGLVVDANDKVGDVDPRGVVEHCFTISDKALAVGGAVVEAVLHLRRDRANMGGRIRR